LAQSPALPETTLEGALSAQSRSSMSSIDRLPHNADCSHGALRL
jgi:hypothetical protein